VERLDDEARALMKTYPWPGNVRELRNAIERGVLLSDGPTLTPEDLPSEIRSVGEKDDGPKHANSDPFRLPAAGVNLETLERDFVVQALARSRGNRTRAAQLLGLNRDQIRYRIEKFQLERSPTETNGLN
jgi:DNA-binding NtrC family response regulator